MNYRWIGAVLVIAGCGGFGFSIAAGYKREESTLRQLIQALNTMEWELSYRLTPLPELCRQAGNEARGALREVFFKIADLSSHIIIFSLGSSRLKRMAPRK